MTSSFVTGGTGFLGSNLVLELLRKRSGTVYCLVRPDGDPTVRLHAAVLASAWAAGSSDAIEGELGRVVAIPGEIGVVGLAIGGADLERIAADTPQECWHAAASLRYENQYKDSILSTNVDGTRHVVEQAAALGIPVFNHISTAYVAGTRVGPVEEGPYDPAFEPNNWYEESKRRGEDVVVAHAESFERTRIMRPSIVVGNLATGRSTSDSGYYGLLAGISRFAEVIENKIDNFLDDNSVRLILDASASADLMPIDALVREAVTMADDEANTQRYAHLTNPFLVSMERARAAVEAAIPRLRVEFVERADELTEYDQFLDRALDFYKPYLCNTKQFLRARDNGTPPPGLEITDEMLVHMSKCFVEDRNDP